MKKEYQTPLSELFVLKLEGIICGSGDGHSNDYDPENWD